MFRYFNIAHVNNIVYVFIKQNPKNDNNLIYMEPQNDFLMQTHKLDNYPNRVLNTELQIIYKDHWIILIKCRNMESRVRVIAKITELIYA